MEKSEAERLTAKLYVRLLVSTGYGPTVPAGVETLHVQAFARENQRGKHPFLFVSFRNLQHGEPYTIDAYSDAHARAVRRIGLVPAKLNGTTEQCIDMPTGNGYTAPRQAIVSSRRGCITHPPDSQVVYTEPSIEQVTRTLVAATEALAAGHALPPVIRMDQFTHPELKEKKRYLYRRYDEESPKRCTNKKRQGTRLFGPTVALCYGARSQT